jgi:hypothetical protein
MFTGREDILQQPDQCFDPSKASVHARQQHVFVLHGLGGAGKTQIALKFIDKFSDWCDNFPIQFS